MQDYITKREREEASKTRDKRRNTPLAIELRALEYLGDSKQGKAKRERNRRRGGRARGRTRGRARRKDSLYAKNAQTLKASLLQAKDLKSLISCRVHCKKIEKRSPITFQRVSRIIEQVIESKKENLYRIHARRLTQVMFQIRDITWAPGKSHVNPALSFLSKFLKRHFDGEKAEQLYIDFAEIFHKGLERAVIDEPRVAQSVSIFQEYFYEGRPEILPLP